MCFPQNEKHTSMHTKTLFISLLFIFFFLEAEREAQGQYYFSQRYLTRGADTAEIYINCLWYEDSNGILWNGLFHSTDNGQTLTVKRKTVQSAGEGGLIIGDSIAGRLFELPMHVSADTLGVSFDYGANFDFKYFNHIYYPAAGCMAGELYIQETELPFGIYRSGDYGNTFTCQSSNNSLDIREVGTLNGELYGIKWYFGNGPLGLAYSNDFGHTFSTSYLEFPGVPVFDECMIYRGTEPGEIYFVIWIMNAEIYLFHTFDYGQTITFQGQLPYPEGEMLYTAGRTPGTFYIVQRIFVTNSSLYIYFSRDYGVTFTEYYHNLDSTYTEIPSPAKSINFFRCFPNPASDKLTIIFTEQMSGEVEIQFITLTGDRRSSFSLPAGQTKTTIDVSNLVPGLYLLKISSGDFLAGMKKVAIIH